MKGEWERLREGKGGFINIDSCRISDVGLWGLNWSAHEWKIDRWGSPYRPFDSIKSKLALYIHIYATVLLPDRPSTASPCNYP